MPEGRARQMAVEMARPVDLDAILASEPQRAIGSGLEYHTIPTSNFSTDTLLLLSLVSVETAAKVDRYRSEMYGGAADPTVEREWQRRRAELAAWKEAGFPRAPDDEEDPDSPSI